MVLEEGTWGWQDKSHGIIEWFGLERTLRSFSSNSPCLQEVARRVGTQMDGSFYSPVVALSSAGKGPLLQSVPTGPKLEPVNLTFELPLGAAVSWGRAEGDVGPHTG